MGWKWDGRKSRCMRSIFQLIMGQKLILSWTLLAFALNKFVYIQLY